VPALTRRRYIEIDEAATPSRSFSICHAYPSPDISKERLNLFLGFQGQIRDMLLRKQRRAERRMKRDCDARILLEGFAKRDCRIVDVSGSGARLAVSSTTQLPRRFSIAFPSNSARLCELVWRNGTMAGIKFLR
jgi:hypothetical protein